LNDGLGFACPLDFFVSLPSTAKMKAISMAKGIVKSKPKLPRYMSPTNAEPIESEAYWQ